MFRRVASSRHGRRSVLGKLTQLTKRRDVDVHSQIWRDFLDDLSFFFTDTPLTEIVLPPKDPTPAAAAEFAPNGGHHELEAFIPWMWRWYVRAEGQRFLEDEAREQIKHWYLAQPRHRRPDLIAYTPEELEMAAGAWHQALLEAAGAEKSRALEGMDLKRALVLAKRWDDGFWVGLFCSRQYRDAIPKTEQFRRGRDTMLAIGGVLGHCYQNKRVLLNYNRGYDLYVLFDTQDKPHWTAAAVGGAVAGHPYVHEWWGKGNKPVAKKYMQYALDLFGGPARYPDWTANSDEFYKLRVATIRAAQAKRDELRAKYGLS